MSSPKAKMKRITLLLTLSFVVLSSPTPRPSIILKDYLFVFFHRLSLLPDGWTNECVCSTFISPFFKSRYRFIIIKRLFLTGSSFGRLHFVCTEQSEFFFLDPSFPPAKAFSFNYNHRLLFHPLHIQCPQRDSSIDPHSSQM